MKTEVIAFSGKMGSGKDYFSNLIKKEIKNTFNVTFGGAVKEEITEIVNDYIKGKSILELAKQFKVKIEEMEYFISLYDKIEDKKDRFDGFEKNNEIRAMLQYWGTEVRRKQDENYWVNKTEEKIKEVVKEGYVVTITDCRFENEANMLIEKFNTVLVRLNISKEEQLRRIKERDGVIPDEDKLNHSSEISLDNYNKFTLKLNTELYFDEENLNFVMKKVEK